MFAPKAWACDQGNWYDPVHQVCAPYPPPYSPGYQQPPSNDPTYGPPYNQLPRYGR